MIFSRSIVSGVSTNSYALIGNLWIVNQDFDGLSIDSQLSFGRSVNHVSIECWSRIFINGHSTLWIPKVLMIISLFLSTGRNGSIFVNIIFVSRRLSWCDSSGQGFSLEYPSISLHAICKDTTQFPHECIYCMMESPLNSMFIN